MPSPESSRPGAAALAAVLVVLLALAGCGGSAPAAAKKKAEVTATTKPGASATPLDLPSTSPKPPKADKRPTDKSAVAYGRYAVRTFYYSLARRDFAPMAELVERPGKCRGCRDSRAAIDTLAKDGQFQVPGKVGFRSAVVASSAGDKRLVDVVARVEEGRYTSEADGTSGVLAAQRRVAFQFLLRWNAQAKAWTIQDYSIDDGTASTRG